MLAPECCHLKQNNMKLIKWKRKPSGLCPVQAEGYFMNYYFYFRARFNTATIEFSKTEAGWENNLIHTQYTLLTTEGKYEAGGLSEWKCRLLIWVGCLRFMFKRNKEKTI